MKFKEVLTDKEKKELILIKGGRLLLKHYHPDLGGNIEMFILIKQAIEREDTDYIMEQLKVLSRKLGEEEAEKKRIEQEEVKKKEKEHLAKSGNTKTIYSLPKDEKIDKVSDALKTINIGKEPEVRVKWLNKEEGSFQSKEPITTEDPIGNPVQEVSLDELKRQVAKNVEWAKGIKVVDFNQKKKVQKESSPDTDYYEEMETPSYPIEEINSEEISPDIDEGLPIEAKEVVVEDKIDQVMAKTEEIDDKLAKIKLETSENSTSDLLKDEDISIIQDMPKIEEMEALFPEEDMSDNSAGINVKEAVEENASNKNEIEDIPRINLGEAEQEQEGPSKETATIVQELASKELAMDALWKKMEKGKEIGKRFGIKHDILSEIMKEYQKLKQEYDNLKNRLVTGLKIEEQKISEEISAKKKELGEMTSRLKLGKVKEYLSHNRKLSEYQEEMLLDSKQSLFKKIMILAQNRQVQMVIGAALIGVSIAAPPTGFVHLITGGALPGFLPEALGPVAKGVGGVVGGYLAGGLAGLRRKDDDDIDRIVEAENEDIARMHETKFNIPTGEGFARNINYMTLKNPVIKNNFLIQKRRFEES